MFRSIAAVLVALSLFFIAACDQSEPEAPVGEEVEQVEALAVEVADDEPTADEETSSTGIERSLLWRIEGPNEPVWLFGTIHGGVDVSDWERMPAEVRQAFEDSELIVLEIDMDEASSPEVQMALASKMILPEGESLQSKFDDAQWQRLQEIAPMPAPAMDRLQPWAVFSIILDGLTGEAEAVDLAIQRRAKNKGKELDYLETLDEQLQVLAATIDAAVLADTVDRYDFHKTRTHELIEAYRLGDADTLESIVYDAEEMARFPDSHDLLMVERNQNWLTSLQDYIERGGVFVAAGVGHFVGEDSVVTYLEEAGFEISRVSPADNDQ